MKSVPLSSGYPHPFYLIDKDTVRLLDKFVCNQIKLIPHPMRFNLIKKSNSNNLQCFLNLENQSGDYKEVSALYGYVYQIIRAVTSGYNSMESFNARRMLVYGTLEPSTDDIMKYLEDSLPNL